MDGVPTIGVVALGIVLLAVGAVALVRGRYDGHIRSATPADARRTVTAESGTDEAPSVELPGESPDRILAGVSLAEAGIGLPGEKITVVQFSGEFCAVCPQTRTLVERVLRDHPEIAHVEVDVADHLEAVRALDIRRTPTVLIVDGRGRALSRVSRMPREAELRRALTDLVDHR